MSRRADRSGFTLVEALVAFSVMAIVLGVLYRGVVDTRVGAIVFGQRMQAETVARSVLADYRARRDLREGSYAGNRDSRRWTLRATTMDLTQQLPKGMKPDANTGREANHTVWIAQRLVLTVATGRRPLETEAVHLVRAPPPETEAP